jgi:hypothetical protein
MDPLKSHLVSDRPNRLGEKLQPEFLGLKLPERIGLALEATRLLLPALAEHLSQVNGWQENHESELESKWTLDQIQDQLLRLEKQLWPLTNKEFQRESSQSTPTGDSTLNQTSYSFDDLKIRVNSVRDAVIEYFAANSPLSDCFHGDSAQSEKKYINFLFEKVLEELPSSNNRGSGSTITSLYSEAYIDARSATARVEHNLYGRWAKILSDSTSELLSKQIPVYGPPSPLEKLKKIAHQLIDGGHDS